MSTWAVNIKASPDLVTTPYSSVGMLNYLPIAGQAVQLVAELLFSGFSDLLGVRLPFLLLHSVSAMATVS